MPVTYERTADPDVFLEIKTQHKQLSLSELEAQLAELNKQIQEHEDEVPVPETVTARQREAIEFYNSQMQDVIRYVVRERKKIRTLIKTLQDLPE